MADSDEFFREKYFAELTTKLDKMETKIDSIQSKVNYMYAFAAGVGFLASLLWNWLTSKFYAPITPHG